MHKVHSDHFHAKNIDLRCFSYGQVKIWVYGVTLVENGHLADLCQNVSKDRSYY